ncbi:MAG: hypothetical protein HQL06_16100 [Nitrospirae bacterium]|nr:hypothetical protein [Nitrospirota bacterium]
MKAAFITLSATAVIVDIFIRKTSGYTFDETIRLEFGGSTCELLKEYIDDSALTSYLSLPSDILNYRIIEMPFSDKNKIISTLPYALEGLIRGTYDSCVADCIVLGQDDADGRFQVLVVYIDKEALRNKLSELKVVGVEPKAITSLELRYKLSRLSVDALYDNVQLTDEARITMCQEEIATPLINLAKGELAYSKDIVKTIRNLKIALLITALIIMLTGAYTVYKIHLVNNRVETLKSYMIDSYKKQFSEEVRVIDPIYQLKAKIKKIKEERGFFNSISPLQNLAILSGINVSNVVLIELEMTTDKMTLKGEAVKISDVDEYKDKLTSQLADVRVIETKTTTDNKVLFTISAQPFNEADTVKERPPKQTINHKQLDTNS